MKDENIILVLKTFSKNPLSTKDSFYNLDSIGWDDFLKVVGFLMQREYIEYNNGLNTITKIGEIYLVEQKKHNKSKWYNQNWIGYVIALIVLLFTLYKHFENKTLSNKIYILDKKNDSLNIQIESYKDQFFVLKESIEKNK